ncbi:MAG: polysaccharide biosynthesis C-terminal domain-containing protein [Acidobacteriota bacterium]|nr:polysaccharide biosynthesis C-terminal domain-containing protein [Acidobacteriota bacterium]
MAVGTVLSRLTGLLRLVALVYAVHFSGLADAYNLANTMPNVVHDVVLGGIVSATFVPVFVSQLARASEEEAWRAISAVTSVAVLVIGAASVAFLVATPWIIDAMTALNRASGAGAERTVATQLLVLFVPQLACYGCISVATALLNARRRFAAPMFAPIVNNLVLIGALVAFGLVVRNPTPEGLLAHRGQLLLLGLGTTVGVGVQLAGLLPSLRRADLRLRWYPRLGHPAVRAVVSLSGWTVGLVVGNQLALLVVLALAVHVGPGSVTAYTYAYTFFQLPYGVVAVSIMSAAAPELAAHWAQQNLRAFRRRMDVGLRVMLAVVVPIAGAMLVLAKPLLALLGVMIGHASSTGTTAVALAMLSLGLPGFCAFLYVIRVLQCMQDLRSAFWLYALENGVNIVGAIALAGPLGVRGITLSISIAYTVAAVAGLRHVRRKVGGLDPARVGRPVGRVALSTIGLLVGAVLGTSISASDHLGPLLARLFVGLAAGLVGYLAVAAALMTLERRRRGAIPARHRPPAVAPDRLGRPPEGPVPPRQAGEAEPSENPEEPGAGVAENLGEHGAGVAGGQAGTGGDTGDGSGGGGTLGGGEEPGRGGGPRPDTASGRPGRRPPWWRRSRQGRPPAPLPLPPAGRPPLRPTRLGPTRPPGDREDGGSGRLGPQRRGPAGRP